MKKRVLSLFMALALCLTLLPAPVRAEEDTPEGGAIVQEEQQEQQEKAPAAESPAISEQAAENGIAVQDGEADDAGEAGTHTAHCVCGKDSSTTVNGHTHSTGTTWKAADSLPGTAGSYYLTRSVSGDWTVPTGEVNLCLNGQTINGKITVGSGATLTLTDCTGTGKLQGSGSGSGVSINGGTFNLYEGTITGFVNGVEIGSHNDIKTGSSFTMYGGTITDNKAGSASGGGVFLISTTNSNVTAPSFTMHGGTISGNTAGASDGGGGGIYVGEKCSFTMDGGTITGNTATNGNGGGIYIHMLAKVTISGGEITNNTASGSGVSYGGGIYSESGVTVSNVTITGNNAKAGGGIYGKGTIALTDATVTGNNQHDVYYDGTESINPKLTVSGLVKAGYYANYAWKLPILVSGALNDDSVIRVGVRDGIKPNAGGSLLIAEPASGVTLRAENFKADAADCVTSLGEGGKVYLVPCTHEMDDTGYTCKKCHTQFDARVGESAYYQTLTKAFDAAGGSTVTLLRDVTLTGNCSAAYNSPATLDLNGKTVSSERYYIGVGDGNNLRTLTVMNSGTNSGTQLLTVRFLVHSNGTLAVDNSYTGEISRVELQAGGALERFGGKIGELALSNAAGGSTSTGYKLKLWNGNTNACTIGKFTDNNKSKSLTVKDLLGTDYAKCELYGENSGTWSVVDKSTKIAELTGYTAYKVQFPECVHQCSDDSNPVCSVCHKNLYTKITARSTDGSTKTAYFTEDSALEHGYAEAIQTLNGWSNEGCTEPTLTLLRDMYAYGTSMPLTGTLTLKGGTHTAKNVTVAENANVTFASGSYRGATIDGTATVKEGVTFTSTVTVNGTLNAKGGTFDGPVEFNGSSIANISGGSFTSDRVHGGVEFDYNVTGTISGGTFVFADFYTTKVKLSGGTFTTIITNGDRKLADLLAEGAAYYKTVDDQAVTDDSVNKLENVKVVSHTHNGGKDGNGTCSICGKQMAASLTVGGKTSWYAAFATAIEAANAADGAKTITLYQDVNGYADGHSTTYELTRGPVTLATGGKTVTRVALIAKGISLTVTDTGSGGDFNVTVDGKDAELTVNDKDTKLAIVTAKNGGKLSLSNGAFSRVAVKDDGSSASLSGGSYGEITSDAGYVKPYALLAKGYAYKKTKDNEWLPNANSIPSEVTVEKAPFAVEKIYPNNDTNYTENSAFATDGSITLTAVIAPETQGVTYYYWWELFNESKKDWTTHFGDVNTATHTGEQSKTLSISNLPENSSYQYHVYVSSDNGYNCYSEPFTVTRHEHSWTYTASGATITATCSQCSASGGSVTIAAPDKSTLTYDGNGKAATLDNKLTTGATVSASDISYHMGESLTGNLPAGNYPTDAGEYKASITVGGVTASVAYTIEKATPKAEDFIFAAPTSLTYDGNTKSPDIKWASGVSGMGKIGMCCYNEDGEFVLPKDAGTYTVKINVAEGTNYKAATELTADGWKFSITKAAAPTNIPSGTLNIINGTHQTYTYDFSKLLPELSEGQYGTVSYGNQPAIFLVSQSGYYYDQTTVEFKNGVLTLAQFYAKDGTMTGQIGTVNVTVTTTNYNNFQLTLVLNAVNQIKPTPDGKISASEITYGDTLSKSEISGKMKDPNTGDAVNGTFAWTAGTINPKAGDYEADWTFTPAAGYEKYATVTGTVTVKVNKATPTFNAPTAQENLTYTGQEQALIIAGSVTSGGTMQYSLTENGKYSQDIPTGTDAGAYTVWYRVIGDANHNDTAPASVAVRIGKKPLTITGVMAASKTYDGTKNADITSVTFDNVTLKRDTDYTVTASFDDASVGNSKNITATVTLMEQAARNYALEQSSFPTTGSITKAAAPDFTKETALTIVNGHEKTYTVTLPALPTLETPKEYGALTYEIGEIKLNDGYYTSGAKVENGELTLPIQKNDVETTGSVGTVTVVIKSANYEDITLTVNVNATNKLIPTVTAPTANALTYNGSEQALVTAGQTTGGTMLYRLGDSEWSEHIPTAKNAGEYTVWYKVQGNAEYADVAEQNVTVTIAKKSVTVTALDKSAYTGSTAPDLSSPEADKNYKVEGLLGADTLSGTVTLTYAQTPDMSKPGKTAINITGTLSNDNYEITYVPGTLTVSDRPSSGGGGSSSDRDTSSSGTVKTETTKNNDGSVTKTETKRDGTVIETTTGKDGSVSKTTTNPNGSSMTESKDAAGSTGTVKTDKNGQTTAETALSSKAIETAKRNGEPVKAPVEVKATRNSDTAPTVKVELPKNSGDTKVEIPVSNVKPGTVAVIVHPDGTEEIVKNSLPTEDGIQLTINGGATVKIVDNSKDFIDTRSHWAKDAIDFVSARGLVSGMSGTTYAPDASTTRAQLWTILARQDGADLTGGNTWYEKAQNWAKDKGVSDGANPNGTINRAQMVTMLWRAMGQPAPTAAATFTDVSTDSYYAQAVAWAIENGITAGVGGGRFAPNSTCTRAQIATFLYRSYQSK